MERGGPDVSDQRSHDDAEYRRIELITGSLRRRAWSAEQKAAIVAESFEARTTVSEVARRHQLSRGLLWAWRREARMALAAPDEASFVSVRVSDCAEPAEPGSGDVAAMRREGLIEVEIGRARVRVLGGVDPDTLRQVLQMIGQLR